MLLSQLLAEYQPNNMNRWSWDDEERDILARLCLCCGQPGHYQQMLEAHIAVNGLDQGICLGENGLVWDGHHRIVAARRLGVKTIPLESREEADARWKKDHGDISWEERTRGDIVVVK